MLVRIYRTAAQKSSVDSKCVCHIAFSADGAKK